MRHTKTCLVTCLGYLLITMDSSIFHCFNITGWRKYAHQRTKFSTVVKLPCISIHIPNFRLDLQNFNFSMVRTVKRVELHHFVKFCRDRFSRGRGIFRGNIRCILILHHAYTTPDSGLTYTYRPTPNS